MPRFLRRSVVLAGILGSGVVSGLVWCPRAEGRDTLKGPLPARVERVIDGDTFDARVKIWLGQEVEVAVRLKGIDAPELHGGCAREREGAEAARVLLAALLEGGEVMLSDIEADKYGGRVDAVVTLADGRDVGEALLDAGRAAPYGAPATVCDAS